MCEKSAKNHRRLFRWILLQGKILILLEGNFESEVHQKHAETKTIQKLAICSGDILPTPGNDSAQATIIQALTVTLKTT